MERLFNCHDRVEAYLLYKNARTPGRTVFLGEPGLSQFNSNVQV
jgi:hypothetical protein